MWQGLWNWQIPENGSPEENEKRCRAFTLDHVVEWFEKYENIWMSAFVSLKRMSVFLKCTNRLGSPYSLLSIKCVGSIDLERTASPFKHLMLTKERNSLSPMRRGSFYSGLVRI
jgi:hypothetical protein